jgi:hypothetical protein
VYQDRGSGGGVPAQTTPNEVMMSKWRFVVVCVSLLGLALMGAAQDVPLPPKPDPIDPALAESLKQTLLSAGRVEYSFGSDKVRNKKSIVTQWSIQVTSAVVDARGCTAVVDLKNIENKTDFPMPLFFETIDTVEVLSQQEAQDRPLTRAGMPLKKDRLYWYDPVYALVINGAPYYDGYSVVFSSEAQANQAAEAVRRAAQNCRAVPVTLNAAAGAPSLADTMQFIQDKLNENGAVDYQTRAISNDEDSPPDWMSVSYRLTQAGGDPATCLLRFHNSLTNTLDTSSASAGDIPTVLSFRRLRNLEVTTNEEMENRAFAKIGSTLKDQDQPQVYVIGGTGLQFLDQQTANRVANAMNHAIQLCGTFASSSTSSTSSSPSTTTKPEPF